MVEEVLGEEVWIHLQDISVLGVCIHDGGVGLRLILSKRRGGRAGALPPAYVLAPAIGTGHTVSPLTRLSADRHRGPCASRLRRLQRAALLPPWRSPPGPPSSSWQPSLPCPYVPETGCLSRRRCHGRSHSG